MSCRSSWSSVVCRIRRARYYELPIDISQPSNLSVMGSTAKRIDPSTETRAVLGSRSSFPALVQTHVGKADTPINAHQARALSVFDGACSPVAVRLVALFCPLRQQYPSPSTHLVQLERNAQLPFEPMEAIDLERIPGLGCV